MQIFKEQWQTRAQRKVAETLSKIPPQWRLSSSDLERAKKERVLRGPFIESFLEPKELEIIHHDTVELSQKIRAGDLTARRVAEAFCRTAAVAHQINNCLHEIFFDQALERAEELDSYYTEHGKTMGSLHGIPVSLKDQFHVKGNDATMGYVGWIDTYEGSTDPAKVHKIESQVVKELLSLGAILYCTTSLPQTLLIGETINNIIGQTLNPHNQLLSCGGSSGGEAALKALRGSIVGVGTDIGGSVRIPAAFCGVFSLKPTPERFSYRDVANTNPGQDTYRSTVGFLSTTIDGLQLIASSVLSTEPWLRDPAVIPLPWRQDIIDDILSNTGKGGGVLNSKPLKIGIFWNDGIVQPQPPIARGIRQVATALSQAGHKCVDWEPPSQETAKRVHLAFLKADGAHDVHQQLDLSGEPLIPPLRQSFELRDPVSLLEYQDLTLQGLVYERAYTDYWQSTSADDGQAVDAVVMPVAPHAAVIPGKFYYTAYTESINLMNYSACVIPVTKADKDIDIASKDFKPLSEIDGKNWDAYDAEVYDGAPVGLQIVGRKFQEEKMLAIATVIKAALDAAD